MRWTCRSDVADTNRTEFCSQGRMKSRCEDNVKIDRRKICCQDGRRVTLCPDRVHWRSLELALFSLWVLLPLLLRC
jgi:hypothetical protein